MGSILQARVRVKPGLSGRSAIFWDPSISHKDSFLGDAGSRKLKAMPEALSGTISPKPGIHLGNAVVFSGGQVLIWRLK